MFSKARKTHVSKLAMVIFSERGDAKRNVVSLAALSRRAAVATNDTTIRSSFNSFIGQTITKNQYSHFSTLADDAEADHFGPVGELFDLKRGECIDENLVGKTASIRRVFGPSANAHGLLTCGGEELARHSSFDPDYSRARGWIQNRAIGPAVLSPVLISGLVGALVEAAFPQSVPVNASMHQARPLIVGQEVRATVRVIGVKHYTGEGEDVSTKEKDFGSRQDGDEIQLVTEVARTQDKEVIAEGSHSIWIPGFLSR